MVQMFAAKRVILGFRVQISNLLLYQKVPAGTSVVNTFCAFVAVQMAMRYAWPSTIG